MRDFPIPASGVQQSLGIAPDLYCLCLTPTIGERPRMCEACGKAVEIKPRGRGRAKQ